MRGQASARLATGGGTRDDALCCECPALSYADGGDVANGCVVETCGDRDGNGSAAPRNPATML